MDQFVIYIIQSMKQKAIKYSVWSIEKCNIVQSKKHKQLFFNIEHGAQSNII